jgi:hypothetical protein
MEIAKVQQDLFRINEQILYYIAQYNPVMKVTPNSCGTLSFSTLDYAEEQQKRFHKYSFKSLS